MKTDGMNPVPVRNHIPFFFGGEYGNGTENGTGCTETRTENGMRSFSSIFAVSHFHPGWFRFYLIFSLDGMSPACCSVVHQFPISCWLAQSATSSAARVHICIAAFANHFFVGKAVGFTGGRLNRQRWGRPGRTCKDLDVICFIFRVVFVSCEL